MDFICFGIDLYLLFFFWLTRRRRMWERFFPSVMSCFLFYSWCNITLSFQCVQKLGNSEDRRWLSFPQYNSVSVYVGFILLAHSWNLIHFISLFTFNVKCLHICFRTVMAIFLINLNLRLKFVRFKLSNLFFSWTVHMLYICEWTELSIRYLQMKMLCMFQSVLYTYLVAGRPWEKAISQSGYRITSLHFSHIKLNKNGVICI